MEGGGGEQVLSVVFDTVILQSNLHERSTAWSLIVVCVFIQPKRALSCMSLVVGVCKTV